MNSQLYILSSYYLLKDADIKNIVFVSRNAPDEFRS